MEKLRHAFLAINVKSSPMPSIVIPRTSSQASHREREREAIHLEILAVGIGISNPLPLFPPFPAAKLVILIEVFLFNWRNNNSRKKWA